MATKEETAEWNRQLRRQGRRNRFVENGGRLTDKATGKFVSELPTPTEPTPDAAGKTDADRTMNGILRHGGLRNRPQPEEREGGNGGAD